MENYKKLLDSYMDILDEKLNSMRTCSWKVFPFSLCGYD